MTTQAFAFTGFRTRVLFGAGRRREVAAEAEVLGMSGALILTTARGRGAGDLRQALGGACVGVFAEAAMHTPVAVTEKALAQAEALGADGFVALGGGSSTGLAKALALRTDLPQIILPTTYAGSEVTDILGQTEGGAKTTVRSPRVLPETVIYDVDLTVDLPTPVAVASGLNAMAHAVEALYAPDANPITSLMAEEGLRALSAGLVQITEHPGGLEGREAALYGAWLCGLCLGSTAMGLHHKLCHILGGMFDLPHADTHAVMLPHVAAYNMAGCSEARERAAGALGGDPPAALWSLSRRLGAAGSLRELGMPQDGIAAAAAAAVANPYANPTTLDQDAIQKLLDRAWAGEAPVFH